MKTLLLLALVSAPALACDWQVKERVDPMTDHKVCLITSASARLGIEVRGQTVTFATGSPYRDDQLTIRVDDNPPVLLLPRNHSTESFGPDARNALGQILSGQRIRTQWRSYPATVNGDAPICNLPELIRNCGA